jgi:citrate synthase
MGENGRIHTNLATHDADHIWVRGVDLAGEAMDGMSFGGIVLLLITGRKPEPVEVRLVDAVLVSLVEHGMTPSAMVSRVTYSLAPDSIQGAVAAGLLGIGGTVLGSMEGCGELLEEVELRVAAGEGRLAVVTDIIGRLRAAGRRVPGIGHAFHKRGDPRAIRLMAMAEELGYAAGHLETLRMLAGAASSDGKPLPINVTGAVAAVLLGIGLPWQLHRGFALIARTAGLVAHIGEERESPITGSIRALIRES